jgi:hypothetical protein
MLFRGIIVVYSQNDTKHKGKNLFLEFKSHYRPGQAFMVPGV